MYRHRAFLVPAAALAALAAFAARAEAVETGQVLGDVTPRGSTAARRPWSIARRRHGARVLQDAAGALLATLKAMASCQPQLAGKPVRWVGIVPGDTVAADAKADVAASGMKPTVLVDEGDALYAKLGVRTHPIAVGSRAQGGRLRAVPRSGLLRHRLRAPPARLARSRTRSSKVVAPSARRYREDPPASPAATSPWQQALP
jgi:hypothetical protein